MARWTLLSLVLLTLGLWNLDGPAPWWDEGWTLSVARNWAEQGHYGRLRAGEWVAPGLSASFTTTLPVGVAMRLLGVGLWQGRVFGVLCAVGVLLLLSALAARLYGRGAARATIAVALLMTMHSQIHPLLQGRQVMAEMPMLLYLLAGYLCLWWALSEHRAALLPAALLLGLAWVSKGQTVPFLLVSLAMPLLAALLARRWTVAAMFALTLAGTYATARALSLLAAALLYQPSLPSDPIEGLVAVLALVLTPLNRAYALLNLFTIGLPTLLALLWAFWALWRERTAMTSAGGEGVNWYLRLTLLGFTGSWLAWYALLSVALPRYLGPPVIVGSIFVAELLRALTGGFKLSASAEQLMALLRLRWPGWAGAAALLAVVLCVGGLTMTGQSLARAYLSEDRAAQRVADALDALPAGMRIETYESELHFMLDQPYHYPPDQVHVELNRRTLLGETVTLDYDPLATNPDYLVVGVMARWWQLYEPSLASGAFELAWRDGHYAVYRHVPLTAAP